MAKSGLLNPQPSSSSLLKFPYNRSLSLRYHLPHITHFLFLSMNSPPEFPTQNHWHQFHLLLPSLPLCRADRPTSKKSYGGSAADTTLNCEWTLVLILTQLLKSYATIEVGPGISGALSHSNIQGLLWNMPAALITFIPSWLVSLTLP